MYVVMACTFNNYIPLMKIQQKMFAWGTLLTTLKHSEYKQKKKIADKTKLVDCVLPSSKKLK